MIKHGICIEIDVLGNHTLKGPGDLVNLKCALVKHQLTTLVSLTHVHCYEFDHKFYCDMQVEYIFRQLSSFNLIRIAFADACHSYHFC